MRYFQLSLFVFLLFSACHIKLAQQHAITQNTKTQFAYESAENDSSNTRIYTLNNGLKVYTSIVKDKPRIQTYISVNAGSKNDPADATGLAHYLEHLLFKGSEHIGTINYEKEKELLIAIEQEFENYRQTTDSLKRKTIYRRIDSLSFEASKYAIPNEFDRLLSQIGATGTNAYTTSDNTTYVNNIPSNQLYNWLNLEYERFKYPVFRLFHTELEAVYEEKNTGLDSDMRQAYYATLEKLFLKHPYGTQTTIGTIEHLKNPSIKKIKEFYNQYYVPNNMAVVLVGDFNPDSAIAKINSTLGTLPSKTLPQFKFEPETPIEQPRESTVYGPEAEFLMMGFPFSIKPHTKEGYLLNMVDLLLNNAYAGLIDINLNQQQKVTRAGTYLINNNDYAAHIFYGYPTQNQSLEQVRDLIFEQIENLQNGNFASWLPAAIVKNKKLEELQNLESAEGKAGLLLSSFNQKTTYQKVLDESIEMEKLSKQDIVDFCKKYYHKNKLVITYKKNSSERNSPKVQKPKITPIQINRDKASAFANEFLKTLPQSIAPQFIDYSKEFNITPNRNGSEFWYKKNTVNELFSITIHYDFGSYEKPLLETALSYFNNLGSTTYSNAELHEEFYKLACDYSFSTTAHETSITLSGLSENMLQALQLLSDLLNNTKADEEALKRLKMKLIKQRNDEKLSKDVILWKALSSYVLYGENSPFTNRANPKKIEILTSAELLNEIKALWNTKNQTCYYGPLEHESAQNKCNAIFSTTLNNSPNKKIYTKREITKPEIYLVDYNMQQANIGIYTKGIPFTANLAPTIQLFNEYFGGDMSSITFQEIREAKALAYSANGSYNEPYFKEEPYTFWAAIGTQADKTKEAILAMDSLIRKVPYSEKVWNSSLNSTKQNIETSRILKDAVFTSYRNNLRLGYTYDRRKDVYQTLQTITFKDIAQFQQNYLSNKNTAILMVANLKNIDLNWLKTQGDLKVLSLEQVFGY